MRSQDAGDFRQIIRGLLLVYVSKYGDSDNKREFFVRDRKRLGQLEAIVYTITGRIYVMVKELKVRIDRSLNCPGTNQPLPYGCRFPRSGVASDFVEGVAVQYVRTHNRSQTPWRRHPRARWR